MADTGGDAAREIDDFAAAWDIAGSKYLPAFVVLSVLFALTGAGERPIGMARLADAVHRPASETRSLLGSLGDLVRLDHEVVRLSLGTSSSSPRYHVRIDDRTIKAGGCAPDLFWIADCSGKALRVDTVCRVTRTPIRVELDHAEAVAVEPETTVVAVVHPRRQPELMATIDATIDDTAGPDEDFCFHQPFFATPEAGSEWMATHPGGRLFTVAEFLRFWRRVTMDALAEADVNLLSGRAGPVDGARV